MSQKFGYASVDEFKAKAQATFSLLDSGVLDQASTRLLLINVRMLAPRSHSEKNLADKIIQGMNDGLMPIEDSMLALQHGSHKEARYEMLLSKI